MLRSLGVAVALAFAATMLSLPLNAHANDRALPMRFDLRLQGPAESCGATCKTWIFAAGAITADSARDFKSFARDHDLAGATVVLDSDGGSVLGALALGREIRKRALATTVGRVVDLRLAPGQSAPRAVLSPRADCESMCAFVLLGGVHRFVPPQARVMVHQIWLGDRRDDPTAATYSAEDLVLVQRDIGRLAQFTAEMGASIDLLDLALRIPPWEPLHSMTRDEIRSTRLATDEPSSPLPATVAASPPAVTSPAPPITDGVRAATITEKRWAMVDRTGAAALARHHPLTVEGDTIGSFDLVVACGADSESFDLSYVEHRYGDDRALSELSAVSLRVGQEEFPLKVASSARHGGPDELVTYAAGPVPAAMVRTFAAGGSHSVVIETKSKGMTTVIRLGNTGAQQNLPRLAASCGKPVGDRAELAPRKAGGFASAQ